MKKIEMFFFIYNREQLNYKQEKHRMSNTTTSTFITKRVNGAKDLKEYIGEVTRLVQEIRDEFSQDLQGPKAIVEQKIKTSGSRNFRAHMATIAHHDFIYERINLPQSSKFLQAEIVVNDCLDQLEAIRKMLVTNKQQKRTSVRNMRQIITGARAMMTKITTMTLTTNATTNDNHDDYDGEFGYGDVPPCSNFELEYECPTVTSLKSLIETTKQNHRTVTRNLLTQASAIMSELRHRHIRALKVEAENAIGEIIHHAEKCRAFIAHLYHLDLIEYCASTWWFENHTDAMDYHSEYIITVIADDEPRDFDASVPQTPYTAFPYSTPVLKICVHCVSQRTGQEELMCEYVIDQDIADAIMTEEAVRAFEHEQQQWQ